jgi:hypothetical protein
MTRATFGRLLRRQFAEFDRDSSSWRTWPAIGLWGSTPFSGSWPKQGMTRSGCAYELPTSVPHTDVSGCSSSLPTPRSSRDASGTETMYAFGATRSDHARPQGQVLLPTPAAADGNGGGQMGSEGHMMPLPGAVIQLLPTATSRDHKGANQRGDATCLTGALLPTPTVGDGQGGGKRQGVAWGDTTKSTGDGGASRLRDVVGLLLPTPAAHDSHNTPENHLRKKPGRTMVTSLQVIVDHGLIPTGGRIDPPSNDGNEQPDA